MGRTIAVGRAFDPGKGLTDLVLLPGEEIPPARAGLTVYQPETLDSALVALRLTFAKHAAIATLGGATVAGEHPWREAIERRLIEFLEDLGNCPQDSLEGAVNAIRNGASIAEGYNSAGLAGALAGKAAICIGAGPSATPEALAKIREIQGTHYIFACDAMVEACAKAGIVPHFVTMLERVPEMIPLVEHADPASTFIAMPVVDPRCAAKFTRTVWYWGGDDLYTWLHPGIAQSACGRSSGTLSVGAALAAGCNPVYLVGHDLAYGPDRAGHSTAAHFDAADGQRKKDEAATDGYYEGEQWTVAGYSGQPVLTNGAWSLMRGDIELMVADCPDRRVISAQDGMGAAISGVISGPLPEPGGEKVSARPTIMPVPVLDPRGRLPSIRDDISRIMAVANRAQTLLYRPETKLNEIAAALAIGAIVSAENRPLFRYVTRTIATSLSLRLHLRAEGAHNAAELQRECLALQASTYIGLCHRMILELFK